MNLDAIKRAVAAYYEVPLARLVGQERNRAIARPRMVVMYLARQLTDASYPDIGRALGGRNHSTIMSGVRKISQLLTTSNETRLAVRLIRIELEKLEPGGSHERT